MVKMFWSLSLDLTHWVATEALFEGSFLLEGSGTSRICELDWELVSLLSSSPLLESEELSELLEDSFSVTETRTGGRSGWNVDEDICKCLASLQ